MASGHIANVDATAHGTALLVAEWSGALYSIDAAVAGSSAAQESIDGGRRRVVGQPHHPE